MDLSRAAGSILLGLLEQPRCRILERALIERSRPAAKELTTLRALVPASTARSVIVADDRGERTVDVEWDPQSNAYRYFDATDGYVQVPDSALIILELDLAWWLGWLADHLQLAHAGRPVELVPRHAWDLGDIWVDSRRKVPLVFARRHHSYGDIQNLHDALTRRPGRAGGILLSSTPTAGKHAYPHNFFAHSIGQLISPGAARFEIDRESLIASYSTPQPARIIELSPDGSALTIGADTMVFRGPKHQKILRELVNAFHVGKRLRTADVLRGLSANSFAKAFKGNPNWPKLQAVLRQANGMCWLEL